MSGLTRRDQALLEAAAAGKSGVEIGQVANVPPAQAILRVQELLQDMDIWSEVERRQLLVHDMYRLKTALQQQVEDGGYDPRDVTVLLKSIGQISEMLDSASKLTDAQLDRITAVQAGVLYNLVLSSFGRAKQVLAEQFPDADMMDIEDAFNQGLREGSAKLLEQ